MTDKQTQTTKIYDMALHEIILEGPMSIMRVASGWVYGTDTMMVFVPFDNSFQKVNDDATF